MYSIFFVLWPDYVCFNMSSRNGFLSLENAMVGTKLALLEGTYKHHYASGLPRFLCYSFGTEMVWCSEKQRIEWCRRRLEEAKHNREAELLLQHISYLLCFDLRDSLLYLAFAVSRQRGVTVWFLCFCLLCWDFAGFFVVDCFCCCGED